MINKYLLPIPEREPDGQFESEAHWIVKAQSWIGGRNPLCADAKNRICACGADFERATAEKTYPVRFWYGAGGQTVKEQRASQRKIKEIEKLNHPWR